MTRLIDGKKIAQTIQAELKQQLATITTQKPSLTVLLVGENPASEIYVRRKAKACEEVGILSDVRCLPESTTEKELSKQLKMLNSDPNIDGILVQLPLPSHIDTETITEMVDPTKDVDGFHPENVGKLLLGKRDGFIPCTPLGIQVLLQRHQIEIEGKNLLILGRSRIVGKPLAALFMQDTAGGNATVTVAHSRTKDLQAHCLQADIVISAIGRPKIVKREWVKEGAVVVDVGINRVENKALPKGYEIVGDVDFDQVKEKCSYITPVPGGVGPMTIAMLLQNTVKSFTQRKKS